MNSLKKKKKKSLFMVTAKYLDVCTIFGYVIEN